MLVWSKRSSALETATKAVAADSEFFVMLIHSGLLLGNAERTGAVATLFLRFLLNERSA
jgi:hypothetical protein